MYASWFSLLLYAQIRYNSTAAYMPQPVAAITANVVIFSLPGDTSMETAPQVLIHPQPSVLGKLSGTRFTFLLCYLQSIGARYTAPQVQYTTKRETTTHTPPGSIHAILKINQYLS